MSKFIIRANSRDNYGADYIAGGMYQFQGEKYACYADKKRAKRYSTRKRAENAAAAYYRHCANVVRPVVEEVDE